MPPLPKRKYSKSRQGERRSHMRRVAPFLVACPQCHNLKLAHRVCPTCGTYGGRQVIKVKIPGRKG